MRRSSIFLLIFVACATSRVDTITAVQARERQWLDAYEKRDAAAMAAILHDDFVITYPDSRKQTKAEVVAFVEKQSRSGKAGPRFHTEDVTAHAANGVVVLTGKVIAERDGASSAQHYTDTYVFERGRWQVLASQLTN